MRLLIIFLAIFLSACTSVKSTVAEIENLKKIVTNKKFEIISDSAHPYGISARVSGIEKLLPPGDNRNNINLIGNPNFFKVRNDSVFMELPYYGQQRISRGYNPNGGLIFKGKPQNYKAIFNEKKQYFTLEYQLQAKQENFTIVVTLFPNNVSYLFVNSSHRSSIGYDGNWQKIQ